MTSLVKLGAVDFEGTFTLHNAAVLPQPPVRSTFKLEYPDGSFIQFTARLIPGELQLSGDLPVSLAEIEDVLEGNTYDHEGAD